MRRKSYYQLNRKELLEKAYDKYHIGGDKEKTAKYYKKNKEWIKQRERDRYYDMSDREKEEKLERSRDRYYRMKKKILDNIKDEQVSS